MRRHLLALLVCVLLCLMVLPSTASADSGPKPAVTITVVNALAGEYYLDLLVTDPGDHANIDPADYDPNLLQGLRDWEVDGWYPALAGGTSVPLFGDLRPGEDGTHRFTYYGLPRAFRIAVSGPDGGPGHGRALYPHGVLHPSDVRLGDQLHYKGHLPAGFYGVQFLSTLVPTLIIEGVLLWLFGFRARRDWLVFLAVNLVTQAGAPPVDCGRSDFHRRFCPPVSGAPRGGGAYFAGGADYLCVPAEGVQRAPPGGLRRLRQYRQLCRGLSSSPLGGGISGPVRRFVLHGRQNTV